MYVCVCVVHCGCVGIMPVFYTVARYFYSQYGALWAYHIYHTGISYLYNINTVSCVLRHMNTLYIVHTYIVRACALESTVDCSCSLPVPGVGTFYLLCAVPTR
jgi:hypothetical protein